VYILVGALEHKWIMTFHSVGNVITPADEVQFFPDGLVYHQPDIFVVIYFGQITHDLA